MRTSIWVCSTVLSGQMGQGPWRICWMFGGSEGSTPTSPKYLFHCAAPKAQEGSASSGVGDMEVEMGLGCEVWMMGELFKLGRKRETRSDCNLLKKLELSPDGLTLPRELG